MPMKMPFGPPWFQDIEWNTPNALMATVPGFENVATAWVKQSMKNQGVASIPGLRDLRGNNGCYLKKTAGTGDLPG
jgi:hypothetical protein